MDVRIWCAQLFKFNIEVSGSSNNTLVSSNNTQVTSFMLCYVNINVKTRSDTCSEYIIIDVIYSRSNKYIM